MSKWSVYDERGGLFLGYVDAADRDAAIAWAIGKFDHIIPSIVHVRKIADVPCDIPIDEAKITRLPAMPPARVKLSPEDMMLNDAPIPSGEESWRDGPRDDGSYESDDILPDDD